MSFQDHGMRNQGMNSNIEMVPPPYRENDSMAGNQLGRQSPYIDYDVRTGQISRQSPYSEVERIKGSQMGHQSPYLDKDRNKYSQVGRQSPYIEERKSPLLGPYVDQSRGKSNHAGRSKSPYLAVHSEQQESHQQVSHNKYLSHSRGRNVSRNIGDNHEEMSYVQNSEMMGSTSRRERRIDVTRNDTIVTESYMMELFTYSSNDILQYEKHVSALGQQIYALGLAQAELWKCRLKIDSINELGKKIERQLRTQEEALQNMTPVDAAEARTALTKLTRDYRHLQASFKNLKNEFGQRQKMNDLRLMQEEELKAQHHEFATNMNPTQIQFQVREDEYAEHIMREREGEIKNINTKMHQVNDIFQDLGRVVEGQQEQVDHLENNIIDARDNVNNGLHQLQAANGKPKTSARVARTKDHDNYTVVTEATTGHECSWPTLDEYFAEAKKEVKDLIEFGGLLIEFSVEKLIEARKAMTECAAERRQQRKGTINID